MAFLAVVREGLETSLIFYSAVQGANLNGGPLLALTGGVLTAVAIGYLMYATAVRINLAVFFTWTGALLILVAAGIFKYGVHDFQEAGILPGIGNVAYHVGRRAGPVGVVFGRAHRDVQHHRRTDRARDRRLDRVRRTRTRAFSLAGAEGGKAAARR